LVTQNSSHRDFRAQKFAFSATKEGKARPHLGKNAFGNTEEFAKALVPREVLNVEKEGAGSIGGIGSVDAAQSKKEPGIYSSREDFPFFRAGAGAPDLGKRAIPVWLRKSTDREGGLF